MFRTAEQSCLYSTHANFSMASPFRSQTWLWGFWLFALHTYGPWRIVARMHNCTLLPTSRWLDEFIVQQIISSFQHLLQKNEHYQQLFSCFTSSENQKTETITRVGMNNINRRGHLYHCYFAYPIQMICFIVTEICATWHILWATIQYSLK